MVVEGLKDGFAGNTLWERRYGCEDGSRHDSELDDAIALLYVLEIAQLSVMMRRWP